MAALWTEFFCWGFRSSLGVDAALALWLAVWILYASDRIYDAMRGQGEAERHRFHLQHRSRFLAAMLAASAFLVCALVRLPTPLRTAWIALGAPLLLYVCAVHVLALRRVPKEPLVAVFFATATATPAFVANHAAFGPILLAALGFGAVCWLNCIAIARWEGTLLQTDPVTEWLGARLTVAACMVAFFAAVGAIGRGRHEVIGCAVLATAALLLLLDRMRTRLGVVTVRALADAALLTPLLVWPVAAWIHPR